MKYVKQAHITQKLNPFKNKKIKLTVKISEFRIIEDMMMQIKNLDFKS